MTTKSCPIASVCSAVCFVGFLLTTAIAAAEPAAVTPPGFYRFGDSIYFGQSFDNSLAAAVTRIKAKSAICVDGLRPPQSAAFANDIVIAHCPIPYNGITRPLALRLAATVQALPKPVYIYSYDLDRPAAAAAIAAIATTDWDNALAVEQMAAAGTSRRYKGLYRDVANFSHPDAAELAEVSVAGPMYQHEDLRQTMLTIDRVWRQLRIAKRRKWKAPKSNPSLDSAFAARYLHQLFQDSEAQEPRDKVRPEMAQARDAAGQLAAAIEAGDSDTAKSEYKVLKSSCFNCHREYRKNTRK